MLIPDGAFADHLVGLLVVTKRDELRMMQVVVRRPF